MKQFYGGFAILFVIGSVISQTPMFNGGGPNTTFWCGVIALGCTVGWLTARAD